MTQTAGPAVIAMANSDRRLRFTILYWTLGLLLGTLLAPEADESLLLMMRTATDCRVSFAALLLAANLPCWIAAFAVFINRYAIFYLTCFLKGFAASLCGALIFRAFGSAGWLIQPMLQFTDTVMNGIFCWFCIRCCGPRRRVKKDLVICFAAALTAVILDYFLVSAFLAAL